MQNRLIWWAAAFFVSPALAGCGASVDPDPFQGSGGSAAAAPPARASTASDSSRPAQSPPASVAPAGAAAAAEAVTQLPLTAPAPEASSAEPPLAPSPVAPAATNPNACASYETGFLPLVHQPVCSSCHSGGGGLPRFEPFAQALTRCAQIGREVASGAMPPRGSLSSEQRALVASWVALDCPETAADAAALCVQPSADADPSAAPPAATPPPVTPPAGNGDVDDDDDDDDRGKGDDGEDDDDRGEPEDD